MNISEGLLQKQRQKDFWRGLNDQKWNYTSEIGSSIFKRLFLVSMLRNPVIPFFVLTEKLLIKNKIKLTDSFWISEV